MRYFIFLFSLVLSNGFKCFSQDKIIKPVFDRSVVNKAVDKAAAKFMSNPEHVGLSIGVIKNGVCYIFNYGTIDKKRSVRPTAHTTYEIASITKSFTGVLLAHAVLEGKVSLNDDIRKYLPFPYPNLSYQNHPIRIIDLANHTSGLHKFVPDLDRDMSPYELVARYKNFSKADFLTALSQVKIDTIPGSKFEYSNAGTQIIGIILENVYHVNYESLVKKYITVPGGMYETGISVDQAHASEYAKGYDKNGREMPEISFWKTIPAAGFLKSTVSDMLKYLQLNMNGKDKAIALAHRPTFMNSAEGNEDIGLFWFSKKMANGFRRIDHAGGSFGSTSYCAIYPDLKLGIVCLTNDASPDTEHQIKGASAEILDQLISK